MNFNSFLRCFIFISLFVFLVSCSNKNQEDNTNINTKPELIVSNFNFDFNNGVNISTNSVKKTDKPHFFYFFTPTWGHCISELQKITPKLSSIPNSLYYAVSIDPTMSVSEIDSFKSKNNLDEISVLPYNKDMLLYFGVRQRGSKRILSSNAEKVYSGKMSDYDINLWEKLLNEKNYESKN